MSHCQFAGGPCHGRLEWHHVVTKNRLKRTFPYGAYRIFDDDPWQPVTRTGFEYTQNIGLPVRTLDEILGDERNRVWCCSYHHELVTNARLRPEIPVSVWDFAADFGLTAQLENDLARAAA